jgi:hypothetical protein
MGEEEEEEIEEEAGIWTGQLEGRENAVGRIACMCCAVLQVHSIHV